MTSLDRSTDRYALRLWIRPGCLAIDSIAAKPGRAFAGFNFKWGHRVIPDPATRTRIYITTFGGGVWHGPAAGDPDAVEDVIEPARRK